MKLIRILHVLGSLNMGGAETFIMNIYRNIDRSKYQFDFIVHGNQIGQYEKEILSLGGKIYHIDKYRVYNHLKYKKIWNKFFIKHGEYKIVHGHMRSTASIYLKIAKDYGLVTICHSHSTSNGKGLSSLVKKILQKNIPKYTDYMMGCSYEANEWLYGKDVNEKDNCYIINNAIDAKKFIYNPLTDKKIRKKYNLEGKFVIGQVGRFIQLKNYNYTINLFDKYSKINKDAMLLLIGDGPLLEKIKNQISGLKLEERVIIINNAFNVNELMCAMNVFIMPSIYEGLPLTLVEAQASSLPCIVSNNIKAGLLIDELINKIDIKKNYDETINLLKKTVKNKRINRYDEMKILGFDISTNVEWFEKFYLNLSEE